MMNFLSIKQDKKRILTGNLAVSSLISSLLVFVIYLNMNFYSKLTRTFINTGMWLIIIICLLLVFVFYDMRRQTRKIRTFVIQIDRIIEYAGSKPIRQIQFTNITDIMIKNSFIDDLFKDFTVSMNNNEFVMEHIPKTGEIVKAIENLNYYNRYK